MALTRTGVGLLAASSRSMAGRGSGPQRIFDAGIGFFFEIDKKATFSSRKMVGATYAKMDIDVLFSTS